MATHWPKQRRLIGGKHTRLDGAAKSTGKAKYSYDINRPGMLHAVMLRSPHAHAKIKKIDTSAAEKVAGFKALHIVNDAGTELFYAGDEILAIAADTEQHALDAIHAVKVEFEVLPHQVKEEDVREKDGSTCPPAGPRKERSNALPAVEGQKGDVATALQAEGVVTIEGTYGSPTIAHQCLESHGLVAEWDADQKGLTVWASTQAVVGTASALAGRFQLPPAKVRCITHFMGGGFGSKFGPDIQGFVAAELAKKAKAPVKLMLPRGDEVTVGGTRPSAFGTVRMGATKDGTITAYEVDCYGSPGIATSRTVGPLPYVFDPPNSKYKHVVLRTNTGQQRAMRAPGHPQSCFLTDCAIDDLAAKLGMDPMLVRIKNLPKNDANAANVDPLSIAALRNTIYMKEIEIAAALSDWKTKWHAPGSGKDVVKSGIGMAIHTWGGQASPQVNSCTVTITRDGSVTAKTSTQDLGTAQRTVTAIVCAEMLGLEPADISLQFGESPFGSSTGSGGSTTCPSQAPAALQAVDAARKDFLDKIAAKTNTKAEDLSLEKGKVVAKGGKSWEWKQACAMLGMDEAKGEGTWKFTDSTQPDNRGISNTGVGGVQIAEVTVDTETGVVKCKQIVAVQDCGMIINKLACEAQVAGGVIMGLNYALFEERIMDRTTGRQVNADMELYKLGCLQDMPKIVVHMHDMPERGVIGIGEPPTISTHAAIANAIFNALGVRVPHTPFTPDRVLAALAAKGGK